MSAAFWAVLYLLVVAACAAVLRNSKHLWMLATLAALGALYVAFWGHA